MKRQQRRPKEPSIDDASSEGEPADQRSEVSFEEDAVDVNERRLALARKAIDEARVALGRAKRVKTAVGEEGAEEAGSQSEDRSRVDDYLQAQFESSKRRLFAPHFSEIEDWHRRRQQAFDHLTLKAHKRPITACCFNPATNDLVSVGKDGAIVLFDFHSGFKRRLLSGGAPKHKEGHSDELLCLDISHDGKLLVTAGKDRTLKVWNLGAYTKDLETMKRNIARGDFAIKGKRGSLVVGHRKLSSEGRTAPRAPNGLPYVEKHPELQLLHDMAGSRDWVTGVRFRHGTHDVVSASADRSLRLWDAAQGVLMETLYGHKGDMTDVDAMAENAVTVGFDKRPIVFKVEKETQVVFDEQLFSVDCVRAVSPHFFVTGSQDGTVALWNLGKRKPLKVVAAYPEGGWTSAIAARFNSDFVVTGAVDANVKFWKVTAKDPKSWSFEEKMQVPSEGVVTSLALSDNCEFLAVVESPENRLGRWTVRPKVASRIKVYKIKRHD